MAAAVGVMPSKDNGGGADVQVRSKTAAGTIKTEVGHSQFFSKLGILPIYESTSNSSLQRTATVRLKQMTRKPDLSSRFPRIEDCAHFHYDLIEMGAIEAKLGEHVDEHEEHHFYVNIACGANSWIIRRSYENFRLLDKQLHKCIYDRKFSRLPRLKKEVPATPEGLQEIEHILTNYLHRFSSLTTANNTINCGPVLNWMEMDNRGNQLIVADDSDINTPAVAAAHVIKRYMGKAHDELNLEVGDMISVIDMPPPEDTIWWRGKKGYQVGFFLAECVEVISDSVPQAVISLHPTQKPVLRKQGKVISFLRSFFSHRPARSTLKERGIVKERVFGCDLGEHLLNSGTDIPLVLDNCIQVIESQGIVDGVYRLSGVASNIQRLRLSFDENRIPDVMSEDRIQDIHSISSLLKMYFRELPNPLLTYQLYDKFAAAVHHGIADDTDTLIRLRRIHDVVQQLPPPHYRTCECLMRHLMRVGESGHETGMHPKNLAIVWAPNLLRSKELEAGSGTAFLRGVGIQAIITEYLIRYADYIFSDKLLTPAGASKKVRPKSLAISTPGRLLSLEEARERESAKQPYIEVGGGTAALPAKYHTIIDLPGKKSKKSPGGGWKSIFSKTKSPGKTKRKASLPSSKTDSKSPPPSECESEGSTRRKLRPAKSADSLIILVNKRISSASITIHNPYAGDISPIAADTSMEAKLSPIASAPSALVRASSHESFFEEHTAVNGTSRTPYCTDEAQPTTSQPSTSRFYDTDDSSTPRQSQSPDSGGTLHEADTKFYIVTHDTPATTSFDKSDSTRSSFRAKIAKAISPKSPRKKLKTQSPASKRRTSSKGQSDLAAKESNQDTVRSDSGSTKQNIPYVPHDESSPDKLRPVELLESPGARRRSVRRFSEPDDLASDDEQDDPMLGSVATSVVPEEECCEVFEDVPKRRLRAHTIDNPERFVVTPEDERLFPGMGEDEQMLLTMQASNARVSRAMSFSTAERPANNLHRMPHSSPDLLDKHEPVARSSVSCDTDSMSSMSTLDSRIYDREATPTLSDLLNMAAADTSYSETESVHTLKAGYSDDDYESDTASAESSFTGFLPTDDFETGVNKQLAGLRASLMKEIDLFSESADFDDDNGAPVSVQAEIVAPDLNTAKKSEQRVMLYKEAQPESENQSHAVSDPFSMFVQPWDAHQQPKDAPENVTQTVATAEKGGDVLLASALSETVVVQKTAEDNAGEKICKDKSESLDSRCSENLNTPFDMFQHKIPDNKESDNDECMVDQSGGSYDRDERLVSSSSDDTIGEDISEGNVDKNEENLGATSVVVSQVNISPRRDSLSEEAAIAKLIDTNDKQQGLDQKERSRSPIESSVWQLGQVVDLDVRPGATVSRMNVTAIESLDNKMDAVGASDDEVTKDLKVADCSDTSEQQKELIKRNEREDLMSEDSLDGEQSETESASDITEPGEPLMSSTVVGAEIDTSKMTSEQQLVPSSVNQPLAIQTNVEETTDAFACFSPAKEEPSSTFDNPCHLEISVRKLSNNDHVAQVKSFWRDQESKVNPTPERPPTPKKVAEKPAAESCYVYPPVEATRPSSLSVKSQPPVVTSPIQDTFSSFALQPKSPPASQTTVTVASHKPSPSDKAEKKKTPHQRPQSNVEYRRQPRERPTRKTDSYIPPEERYNDKGHRNNDDSELLQSAFDLMKNASHVERRKKPAAIAGVAGRKGSFKELRSKFESNEAPSCLQTKPNDAPKLSQPWTAIL